MNKKKIINGILISAFLSVGLSLYNTFVQKAGEFEAAKEESYGIGTGTVISFLIFLALFLAIEKIGYERIHKYRYLIAGIVFIGLVVFGITGSSIGYVTNFFIQEDNDVLYGVSRGIRVDEWGVFTPMTWSQYFDPFGKFSYFSSVVRAESTDVFLEYGQPVASWLMLFKPFFIGYLFLPFEKGMAFFWCGRLIVLFMVSYEFGRLITRDNRKLSFVYAVATAFAPVVQWWFAINGFVEMLISLQLSIVLLCKYLSSDKKTIKILCSQGIVICAGMYVLSMYPAWMIPLGYVLLGMIVWAFIEFGVKKKRKIELFDVIAVLGAVVILGLSAAYVYSRSAQTIEAITSTVYPGKRFETGGGVLNYLFNYVSNIWYSVLGTSAFANPCETAQFLSLFPIGIILYGLYVFKTRKRDLLSDIMLVITVFFLMWCVFGVPGILAKLTFMGSSTANRTIVALGFAHGILLIRSITLAIEEKLSLNLKKVILFSVVFSTTIVWISYTLNRDYYSRGMVIWEILIFSALFLGALYCSDKAVFKPWMSVYIVVTLMSGLLANPVRAGEESVANIPELVMVENCVKNDPEAVWAVEGVGYPVTNTLLLKGARTINSTNVYPDIERWKKVDPDGRYNEVYNRYAHIMISYGESDEKFALQNTDYFLVYLNYDELKKLGVNYIFTPNDYTSEGNMTFIDKVGNYSVYKLD